MVKIILNESQYNKLFEYRSEPRLPFDDDFYGKKNQFEHYLDWLEEFGKYGKIGSSKLTLQNCVEDGVRDAILHDEISMTYYSEANDREEMIESNVEEISNELMRKVQIYDI